MATSATTSVSAIPIDGPDVVVVEFDGGEFACCGEGEDGSSGPVTAAVRASDTDRWQTVRTPTAGPVAAVVAVGPFVYLQAEDGRGTVRYQPHLDDQWRAWPDAPMPVIESTLSGREGEAALAEGPLRVGPVSGCIFIETASGLGPVVWYAGAELVPTPTGAAIRMALDAGQAPVPSDDLIALGGGWHTNTNVVAAAHIENLAGCLREADARDFFLANSVG